jgi:hypothetical protein
MKDRSSPEYKVVLCFDELKVAEYIRKGRIYCVYIKYYV